MTEQSGVTLAICTYSHDRFHLLSAAIDSFKAQARASDEVMVVVDHNESLLQRVRADHADVRTIRNSGARGLSGARNTAIAASDKPLLAFLDDDGVVDEDFVETIVPFFHDPRVVGAGCRVEPVWESDRPAFLAPEFDWVVGCSYRGLPASRATVRNPLGGAMMLRRERVVSAGGFRSDMGRIGSIPLGCEETELFIRLGNDAVVIYEPDVVMHHFVPQQRCSWRYYTRRCFAEGLSKSIIGSSHDSRRALGAERRHLSRTIPAALWSAAIDGRGLAFAGVGLGTASTAMGYVAGRVVLALPPRVQRRWGWTPHAIRHDLGDSTPVASRVGAAPDRQRGAR